VTQWQIEKALKLIFSCTSRINTMTPARWKSVGSARRAMSYLALSTAAHERVKYKDLLLNADSTHFCYSFMKRYKDNKYWAPKNLEHSCISSFTPMKKRFCELWTEISAGGAVAPFVFLIGCSKAELPCVKRHVYWLAQEFPLLHHITQTRVFSSFTLKEKRQN